MISDGREIDHTAKEFDLLLHLERNPGRVSNREQLLDFDWGYKAPTVSTRSIRKKKYAQSAEPKTKGEAEYGDFSLPGTWH